MNLEIVKEICDTVSFLGVMAVLAVLACCGVWAGNKLMGDDK